MTPDRELWACAQHVIKEHGKGAMIFAAQRMYELGSAGDTAGAERWLQIQDRIMRLTSGAVDTATWQ